MFKNNGFYVRRAAGHTWLLMCKDDVHRAYIAPVRLNDTGVYILERIEAGDDTAQIAHSMQGEYGVSYKEAYDDVKAFTDKLIKEGYLRDGGLG